MEQTERDRRRLYLQVVLTNKDHAKEVRAYDAGGFLSRRFADLYEQRLSALRQVVRRRTRQAVVGAALTALLIAGALALILAVRRQWTTLAGRGRCCRRWDPADEFTAPRARAVGGRAV